MSDRIVLAGLNGSITVLEICEICAAMVLPTRMVDHKLWHVEHGDLDPLDLP